MRVDVSVVIPVRNRPLAIVAAITSVREQTLPVREIIVVDDASTDDTPHVVAALAEGDIPVRLIVLPENRGGGAARNAGIDAAKGQLLAFLDSDDRWLPRKLENQVGRISALGTEDYLCFSNLEVDRADGTPPAPWNTIDFVPGKDPLEYVLNEDQAIQTSTYLMPTATARRVRFDDRLRRHQDLDFVFRAARAGVTFVYVPEVLVHYSADVNAVRTSQRRNAAPSLYWMEVARAYLSDAQIGAFYQKHVYDMDLADEPIRAMMRGARGVLAGHATFMQWLRTTIRVLAPSGLKNLIRHFFGRKVSNGSTG